MKASLSGRGEGSFLSPAEQKRVGGLHTNKRRDDWLLGRWTMKRLLQSLVVQETGETRPLASMTISNNGAGVPASHGPGIENRYSISLSHAHGRALAAAIAAPEIPIGADLERIQERAAGFAAAYFTPAELDLGKGLRGREKGIWETAVWSAKEAVLKALRYGLTVDTRAVSCLLPPVSGGDYWQTFAINCDDNRLPAPGPAFTGWWLVEDDFVITIVRKK